MRKQFDKAYYHRYYDDHKTRVAGPNYFEKLAGFIAAYAGMVDLKVGSILDLGAGTGALRKPLLKRFPRAQYVGVDVSTFACERFGWEYGSVVDYQSEPADLVVCHDVVQYLDNGDAKRAIANCDELTSGALFFSVLTEEDWQENCDQARTDNEVVLREAQWYRKRLQRCFRNLGGGLYLSRKSEIALYALEHLD